MSLADAYRADFLSQPTRGEEFPVTTMSADLAGAISELLASHSGASLRSGLDVGTGNGIHAAAMALGGMPRVVGIDVSSDAVEAARRRHGRLIRSLDPSATLPQLRVQDMVELERTDRFDLITTNPPSFFAPPDGSAQGSVMALALFDGDRAAGADPRQSFLYAFFNVVVRMHLAPGGVALCTWPAIEARLADCPEGDLAHPLDQLEKWFNWTFDAAQRDPQAFFGRSATVARYGVNDGLLRQVASDVGKGLYSVGLALDDVQSMTFRYGLLALRRHLHDPDRFSTVELAKVF